MSDLKHLFVPYDLAVKLKEKGFDEYCLRESDHLKECEIKKNNCGICPLHNILCSYPDCIIDKTKTAVKLPLFDQVFNWFFKEHQILIKPVKINSYTLFYEIESVSITCYETKEKAIEEALKLI